jgi:predicted PurR-regulated permease PerM
MSLYREARSGRRRLWIAAAVAVVAVVAVAVFVLAIAGGTQSQAEQIRSLQRDVQPALAALELIPIHYESTNPTTHAAAADQLDVAREAISSVEADLKALDPGGTSRVLSDLADLGLLVQTTGRTDLVTRVASETTADLRALVRLD